MRGVSSKFFRCIRIRKNCCYLFYCRGTIYRAPAKGRHMGLPLPEIVIYRCIRLGMQNNSASFYKAIEFKNLWIQLIIYSINEKVKLFKLEYWYSQSG